jgi:hypothetical protein
MFVSLNSSMEQQIKINTQNNRIKSILLVTNEWNCEWDNTMTSCRLGSQKLPVHPSQEASIKFSPVLILLSIIFHTCIIRIWDLFHLKESATQTTLYYLLSRIHPKLLNWKQSNSEWNIATSTSDSPAAVIAEANHITIFPCLLFASYASNSTYRHHWRS